MEGSRLQLLLAIEKLKTAHLILSTLPPTHDVVQKCEIDKFAQTVSAFIELTENTATVKEQ